MHIEAFHDVQPTMHDLTTTKGVKMSTEEYLLCVVAEHWTQALVFMIGRVFARAPVLKHVSTSM